MTTGVIYRVYCTINGKSYIGQTIRTIEKRKYSHFNSSYSSNASDYNVYFHRAIRKHGKENFIWMIAKEDIPVEELNWYEIYYVNYYSAFGPYGYNETRGGEGARGYKITKEAKKKMSEAKKGKPLSEEHKKKISEAGKGKPGPNKGKILSEETKKKISDSLKGRASPNKGNSYSEETKKKISDALKGENNPMFGKTHSEETKRKISDALKRKI